MDDYSRQLLLQDFADFVPDLSSFNAEHLKLVREKSIELAESRGLDTGLAEVIAVIHDIGRMKDDLDPFDHAESGASFIRSYYKDKKVRKLKTIVSAIREHSRKGRVTTPYSELLKDADSYAHSIEFTSLKPREQLRVDYLNVPHFNLQWISNSRWRDALEESLSELMKLLDTSDVHETRVQIRTLRSLMRLCRYDKGCDEFDHLRKILKDLFLHYELSRKLTVFLEEFSGYPFSAEIEEIITSEELKIRKAIKKAMPSIEKSISRLPKKVKRELSEALAEEISDYTLMLNEVLFSDIRSLHQLRIKGKRLKYLMELGLVTYDEEHYKIIKSLHKSIGRLNDIKENLLLTDSGLFTLDESDAAEIRESLNSSEEEIIREIKKEVYIIRLLANRSYY